MIPFSRSSWQVAAAVAAVTLGCALSAACGIPSLPDPTASPEKLRSAGAEALSTNPKHCTSLRKSTEPDLFGWDSGSRGKVKATAEQGLVVVHFEEHGCDIAISVLNCTTDKVGYRYTPRHALETRLAENDIDLYAHFPVAVADLRARLGANKGIRADYREEGIDMMPIGSGIRQADLKGSECAAATHVVSAIHRGAFAVASGSLAELRAGGTLFDASLKQRLAVFDGDGVAEACDGALERSIKVSGCDEPLRIELLPLDPDPPQQVAAVVAPPPPPEPTPAVAPTAAPPPVQPPPRRAPGGRCPAGMASIPGGTFMMGSNEGDDDDRPAHPVTVAPFCIDLKPVTALDYARCTSCKQPELSGRFCNRVDGIKDYHPRNCVTWYEAREYCTAMGKDLPTEPQREFATRWSWGPTPPALERVCWNRWAASVQGTCEVGAFPAGPFGLFDITGNVWEWTADWYEPYAGEPTLPSIGRVLRGGAWSTTSAENLRTTTRKELAPTRREDDVGFRCALSR